VNGEEMRKRKHDLSLHGAVVLLTGAAHGLGREILLELQRRGAHVVGLDLDAAALSALRSELAPGGEALLCDVSDAAAARAAVAQVLAQYGRLDLVIVNAGVERVGPAWDMEAEDFARVIAVNLLGAFNIVKPALGPVAAAGGHILAIASVAALLPWPLGAAYGASKAGLESFMRSLGFELSGSGASCGTAYLGFVDTAMARRAFASPQAMALLGRMPTRLLGVMPVQNAGAVARALVDGVERRKARLFIPSMMRVTFALRGLYPLFDGWLAGRCAPLAESLRPRPTGRSGRSPFSEQ
jgi:NAD(P)-dependent dehydrogenase (short-subunit alcohol dehydrogenase family)